MIDEKREIVFLVDDDTDRHSQGCDCGFCNSKGKAYGVSIRSIFAPDDVMERHYGWAKDFARKNAFDACKEKGWYVVDYDDDNHWVTGLVKVSLTDIIRLSLEGFLDMISEKLVGSDLLQEIGYTVTATEDNILTIRVEGSIAGILDSHNSEG